MKKLLEKIRNSKNKKAIIMLLIGGALTISGTLAYYSSSADFENLFSAANFSSHVEEVFSSPSDWTPGDTTSKTVTVTNDGDINLKARIKITETWESENGTSLPLSLGGNLGNAAIINFHSNSGWTKMTCGTPGVTYYVYDTILEPEDESETLIDSVTYNPNVVGTYSCTTSTSNGVTTSSCASGQGYNGGTYTLRLDVDTIQANSYSSWNCVAYQGEQEPSQTYTIAFNGNGETSGTTASKTCTIGQGCVLTTNGFSKTGKTFVGWSLIANGAKAYNDGATVNNLGSANETVTLFAVWSDSYTVAFNGNGETSGTTANKTCVVGQGCVLTTNGFSKTGKEFGGWSLTAGGTRLYNDNATVNDIAAANGTITLYAVWNEPGTVLTPSYTIHFVGYDALNGSMNDLACDVGATCTLTPNAYTKTGYTFAGWSITPGGPVVYDDEDSVSNLTTANDTYNLFTVWTTGSDPDPVTSITGQVHYLGATHNVTMTQTGIWNAANDLDPNCNGCTWKANYTLTVATTDDSPLDGYTFRIGLNSGVTGYTCNGVVATPLNATTLKIEPHPNEGVGTSPQTKLNFCEFWYTSKDGAVTIQDDNTQAASGPAQLITGNVTYKDVPLTIELEYLQHYETSASNCGGASPCYAIQYNETVTNNSLTDSTPGYSFYVPKVAGISGFEGYNVTIDSSLSGYYRFTRSFPNAMSPGGTFTGTSTAFVLYTTDPTTVMTITTDTENEHDYSRRYVAQVPYQDSTLEIELVKLNGWVDGGNYVGQYQMFVRNVGNAAITGWAFDFVYTSDFISAQVNSYSTSSITGGLRVQSWSMGNTHPANSVIENGSNNINLTFTSDAGVPNIE